MLEVFGFVKDFLSSAGFPERSEGCMGNARKGVWGKGRIGSFPAHSTERPRSAFLALRFSLSHGISLHLDSVRVVNQPIEDSIGQCWIADLLVPSRDRKL